MLKLPYWLVALFLTLFICLGVRHFFDATIVTTVLLGVIGVLVAVVVALLTLIYSATHR